ncbi:MAG: hypothetical protein RJA90_303, partial [Bacteroidota bacterium]
MFNNINIKHFVLYLPAFNSYPSYVFK